jgi:gamma-tubulin complex component 3
LSYQVSSPFFTTLQRWLFDGELRDPYSEFFVALNPELLTEGVDALALAGLETAHQEDTDLIRPDAEGGRKLWQQKYIFRREMLPSFVDEAFGKKVTFLFNKVDILKTLDLFDGEES